MAWYSTLLSGGQDVEQPTGTVCLGCMEIALDVLYYESWDDFWRAYTERPHVFELVHQILMRIAKKAPCADVPQAEVAEKSGCVLAVETTAIAVFGSALKKRLGVQRLSKEALRSIPSIDYYKGDKEPGDFDSPTRVFLFADPAAEMVAKFTQYINIEQDVVKLHRASPDQNGNLYPDHATSVKNAALSEVAGGPGGWKTMIEGGTPSKDLDTVIVEYNEYIKASNARRRMRGSGSHEWEPPAKVSGRGAQHFEAEAEPAGDGEVRQHLHQDLSDVDAQHAQMLYDEVAGDGSAGGSAAGDDQESCNQQEGEALVEDETTGQHLLALSLRLSLAICFCPGMFIFDFCCYTLCRYKPFAIILLHVVD